MQILNPAPYRNILLCWLLLLLTGQPGLAQQTFLNGRVLDAKTALPIEGASVLLGNSDKMAITNKAGSFSIKTDTVSKGQLLTILHVSYEKFTLKLHAGQQTVLVNLTPKSNSLSEVTVTATRKLKPEKVKPETVLDFAIIQNNLFVLTWETGKAKPSLQVLNPENDSLLLSCLLPVFARELYVDCLNNLHIVTEDLAYQVYYYAPVLQLYPPEPKAAFEQYLRPCLATNQTNAYIRQNANKGLIMSFYAVNQQTAESKLFRVITDDAILKMQHGESRFQFFRNMPDEEARYPNPERASRRAGRSREFAQKVMFKAPYVPLLKIGKEICLFDHVNGAIEFYETDSLLRTLKIDYHLQANWAKKIIVDAAQNKAYALFQKNGLPELHLLNLETGELMNAYKIGNPFAENITVHNGKVFFLYKDPAKPRQYLYKAPLQVQ